MKISDVYKQYKIMPSLQLHMLRVASVSKIISDSFSHEINKTNIITACLLHDMGNILKFNMDLFPEFFQPEGKAYWQNVKDEFHNKYGSDEHEATIAICRDVGVEERIIELVDAFRFSLAKENYENNDMDCVICVYSDMRVEPHGVVSLEKRLEDGQKRFKLNKPNYSSNELFVEMSSYLQKMEDKIFSHIAIKPEDITVESVQNSIEELKGFKIV